MSTTITRTNDPNLPSVVATTEQWLREGDGVCGWCIVSVIDGRPHGYLWDSITVVGYEDDEPIWDNTGEMAFNLLPDAIGDWTGDGLLLLLTQEQAEEELAAINELPEGERENLGFVTPDLAVAFFSRLDDPEEK